MNLPKIRKIKYTQMHSMMRVHFMIYTSKLYDGCDAKWIIIIIYCYACFQESFKKIFPFQKVHTSKGNILRVIAYSST